MSEISTYETAYEKTTRERQYIIGRAYLDRSSDIVNGKVSPNRIIAAVMREFGLTQTGVRWILKKLNIYIDRQHPVNYPDWYKPVQQEETVVVEAQPEKPTHQQPIQAVINFD